MGNARLKQVVADMAMDSAMLKAIAKGKWSARRANVKWSGYLRKRFEISERRACRVVGQPGSTERYRRKPNPEGERFRIRVLKLAGENPRDGHHL